VIADAGREAYDRWVSGASAELGELLLGSEDDASQPTRLGQDRLGRGRGDLSLPRHPKSKESDRPTKDGLGLSGSMETPAVVER
jgi:hypothetical protein